MKLFPSIVIFLLLPVYCFAYDNSLSIDNIELKFGMPKDKVIDLLLKNKYVVEPTSDNGDTYEVRRKDEIILFPFGLLRFDNNKLTYISIRWYYTDTDNGSFELIEKIFALLKQEAQNDNTVKPVVKTSSYISSSGDEKVDLIDIILENKSIRIYYLMNKQLKREIVAFISIE